MSNTEEEEKERESIEEEIIGQDKTSLISWELQKQKYLKKEKKKYRGVKR